MCLQLVPKMPIVSDAVMPDSKLFQMLSVSQQRLNAIEQWACIQQKRRPESQIC